MNRVKSHARSVVALTLIWAATTLFASAQTKGVLEIDTGASAVASPTAVAETKAVAKAVASTLSGGLLEDVVLGEGKVSVLGKNVPEPKISNLDGGRVLMVFKGSALAKPSLSVTGTGLVKTARWAAHGADAHVVLVVTKALKGTGSKDEGGYTYKFDSVPETSSLSTSATAKKAEAQAAKPATKAEVAAIPASTNPSNQEAPAVLPAARLIGQAMKSTENGWKIILTLDSPARYKVLKLTSPDRVLVHFENTKLDVAEKDLRKKLDGAKSKGLLSMEARQIIQKPQPRAEVLVTLAPGASFQVDRDANQVVLGVTQSSVVSSPVAKTANLNQNVSLDVSNADLRLVIQSLAQEAGFESEVSASVTTTVNQHLKDVPLKTALAILLTPGQYKYEVDGNMIRVGTADELQVTKALLPHRTEIISAGGMKATNLQSLVDSILPETNTAKTQIDTDRNAVIVYGTAGDIAQYKAAMRDLKLDSSETDRITRVVKLNYASPTSAKELLEQYLTPMGKAQIDARSQSLVLWETANNMGVLLELIKELDVPLQQVLIESTIVEVNISKVSDIGVDWSASRTSDPRVSASLSQRASNSINPGELSFGTIKSGFNVNAALTALETHQNGKVISRPKIATSNGQEAIIQTTENVVYVTQELTVNNGTSTVTTTSFTLPLPISLKVIPRITDDGRITTDIAVTITSVSGTAIALPGGGQSQPPTTKQEAQTKLTVKNGETIVIGGLVRDTIQDNVNKVPLLGSVPILGSLFRSTTKTTKKVELIIFITPTLMES